MVRLTCFMITKNNAQLLDRSLGSVKGLADEIVVIDDSNGQESVRIARSMGAVVYRRREENLGAKRAWGLDKCTGEWILMLDADEEVSPELRMEIKTLLLNGTGSHNGYRLLYLNHFLGRPIFYGGENYKVLRFFKKGKASIDSDLVHEHVKVDGKVGELKGYVYHHSYRSLRQMFGKFTGYAKREASRKLAKGEKSSIGKIITYPPHMFWARFVKDQGYRDYPLRVLLDLGFAYMELLTYVLLFLYSRKYKKSK